MKTIQEKALELADLMQDGKGEDIAVIDVSRLSSWTDFFVIVTTSSGTHAHGLHKMIKEYASGNDLKIHAAANRKHTDPGDDWCLVDLGTVVVHLMSRDARGFYELEKLWYGGVRLR